MNMLARAAGFENLQHLRASRAATRRVLSAVEDTDYDGRIVERALNQFDAAGRLRRWPAKRQTQNVALWVLWSAFPAEKMMSERDVNACLAAEHLFEDPATLRRTLISTGLLSRKADGTDYRRREKEPPPEAKALIHLISSRRKVRPDPKEKLRHA